VGLKGRDATLSQGLKQARGKKRDQFAKNREREKRGGCGARIVVPTQKKQGVIKKRGKGAPIQREREA